MESLKAPSCQQWPPSLSHLAINSIQIRSVAKNSCGNTLYRGVADYELRTFCVLNAPT
jgi:hypothetical protein